MCAETGREKGVDVALAVDAMQAAHDDRIDVAILVTGDGDMVPVARALTKSGVRVMIAYFDYKLDEKRRSWANDRLLAAANYPLNINALETKSETRKLFEDLFQCDGKRGPRGTPLDRASGTAH